MSNYSHSFNAWEEASFDRVSGDFDDSVHGGPSNTPVVRTDRPESPIKHRKIKILFDWFGFTFSYEFWTVQKVQEFLAEYLCLPLDGWQEGRKNYEGYAESINYENVHIYYNGTEEQGIHVDITGQGCRFCEVMFARNGVDKYNWLNFMLGVQAGGGKFSRIDVAIDDHDGSFKMRDIFIKLLDGEVTSKFRSWSPGGKFDFDGGNKGLTIYFGSKESDFIVCMYEKNKQLEMDCIWNRIELRFKRKRAEDFVKMLMHETQGEEKYKSLGVFVAGILKEYIKFRDPKETDSNKRRWPISPFWEEFLQGVEPQRIASALPDRSVHSIHSWLQRSVSKSLAILLFAYQDINDEWLRRLVAEGIPKLTSKDRIIIEEFKRLFGQDFIQKIDVPEM